MDNGFYTPWEGGAVIPAWAVLPDRCNDLVAAKLKKFNALETWTSEKNRLRKELDDLCERHGYIGFEGACQNYGLRRVGQSLRYDVPMSKRGWLAQFRGKRVRIICLYSGKYRPWLRAGPVSLD